MSIINVANTHAGVFHADEVFASAVLKQIFPRLLIINRVFRPEDNADIVYDIGGGAYDHHQADHEVRPDGIPYAAFGLIWRSFGRAYIESLNVSAKYVDFVHDMVDKTLVRSIDALDNGVSLGGEAFTVSDAISSFNPEWDSDKSADEAFGEAVAFAAKVLQKQVLHYAATAKASSIVVAALETSDGQVIELPCYVPWQEHLLSMTDAKAQKAKYVIFPSNRGGYNIQAVPTAPGAFTNRAPFPEAWRGKRDADLASLCGVKDAIFVHPAGFMGAAQSLEGARTMARLSLAQ